jgi:hypothetical protein
MISQQASKILSKGRYSQAAKKNVESDLASTGLLTSPETSESALLALKSHLQRMQGNSLDHSSVVYKSPEDVQTAYKNGELTKDEASTVLKETFGYDE